MMRHNVAALELIEAARNAVMDCRTQPVTDWITELPEDEAKRLVLALAFIGGTLAALLPDSTRVDALSAYLKEVH
jgi:hypothetical protein